MVESGSSETVLRLTAQIVSAHVEHNSVQAEALPGLIERVYQTLRGVGQAPVEVEKPVPVVPIKQSVKPDFIVCLEDGKRLKMLKRHLMTSYKLTPAQYRDSLGIAVGLPDGRAELCQGPIIAGEEDRAWQKGRGIARQAGCQTGSQAPWPAPDARQAYARRLAITAPLAINGVTG